MIRAARAKVGLDPEGRIAFRVADAASLPFGEESFDLVTLVNMPPFFAEIARVLRPGGAGRGRRELGSRDAVLHARRRSSSAGFRRHGLEPHASGGAGAGTWLRGAKARLMTPVAPLPAPARQPGRRRAAWRESCCPSAERALRARGLDYRRGAHRRASSTASPRRWPRPRAGEMPVVMSGDGLIGQVGGALAEAGRAARGHPGRARQRLRPRARHPDRGRGGGRRCSPRAACARSTSARSTASASSASPAAASTPTPTGSPTRRKLVSGQARLRVRGPAGAGRPGSRPASRSPSTASAHELTGYSVAVANSRAYGGGMFIAPDAELDDGLLDVVIDRRRRQAALPGSTCRRCSRAPTSRRARGRASARAAEVRIEADRPFAVYADGDHDRRPAGDACACCRGRCA